MASNQRILLLDDIPPEQVIELRKKIKALKSIVASTLYPKNFTHLVCHTITRTERFYAACAKGTWIVTPQFVEDSFGVGQWLEESEYVHSSVRDPCQKAELVAAAGRWRWRAQYYGEHPFSGWVVAVLINGEAELPIKRILSVGGAKIVALSLPVTNQDVSDLTYVIMDTAHGSHAATLQEFGLICLHYSFVTDTIVKDEELDLFAYLITNFDEDSPISFQVGPTTNSLQTQAISGEESLSQNPSSLLSSQAVTTSQAPGLGDYVTSSTADVSGPSISFREKTFSQLSRRSVQIRSGLENTEDIVCALPTSLNGHASVQMVTASAVINKGEFSSSLKEKSVSKKTKIGLQAIDPNKPVLNQQQEARDDITLHSIGSKRKKSFSDSYSPHNDLSGPKPLKKCRRERDTINIDSLPESIYLSGSTRSNGTSQNHERNAGDKEGSFPLAAGETSLHVERNYSDKNSTLYPQKEVMCTASEPKLLSVTGYKPTSPLGPSLYILGPSPIKTPPLSPRASISDIRCDKSLLCEVSAKKAEEQKYSPYSTPLPKNIFLHGAKNGIVNSKDTSPSATSTPLGKDSHGCPSYSKQVSEQLTELISTPPLTTAVKGSPSNTGVSRPNLSIKKTELSPSQSLTLPINPLPYLDMKASETLSERAAMEKKDHAKLFSLSQTSNNGDPSNVLSSSKKTTVQACLQRFGFSSSFGLGSSSTSKRFPVAKAGSAKSPGPEIVTKHKSQSPVRRGVIVKPPRNGQGRAAEEKGEESTSDCLIKVQVSEDCGSGKIKGSRAAYCPETIGVHSGARKSLTGVFNSLPERVSQTAKEDGQPATHDNDSAPVTRHHIQGSVSSKNTNIFPNSEYCDSKSAASSKSQLASVPKVDNMEAKLNANDQASSKLVNSRMKSVPVLYGQFMEAARELGLDDVAVSHGRPTCLCWPTDKLLAQLAAIASSSGNDQLPVDQGGFGDSRDVRHHACSYLHSWLHLHPPSSSELADIYARAFELDASSQKTKDGPTTPNFLMDFISECSLDTDSEHFKMLLVSLTSMFEINFKGCFIERAESTRQNLQHCLIVRWLWGNPDGVYYSSRPTQLVGMLGKVLQGGAWSPTSKEEPDLKICRNVCSLIDLAAQCILLASNGWDPAKSNFTSDRVLHLVFDLGRTIVTSVPESKPELTVLLLDFFQSAWLRTLISANLVMRLGTYLLSEHVHIKQLSLRSIVSQFFYLVPHASAQSHPDSVSKENTAAPTKKAGKDTKMGERNQDSSLGKGSLNSPLKWNKRNPKGETPLHIACIKNDAATLSQLLSCPNVDVNITDNNGWTPLHEACNHGSLQCVKVLLQYMPAPLSEDNLHHMLTDENQVNHNRKERTGKAQEIQKIPNRTSVRKADLNAVGPNGVTPLIDAAWNGRVEVCRLLLHYGGKNLLKARSDWGNSALDLVNPAESPALWEVLTSKGRATLTENEDWYSEEDIYDQEMEMAPPLSLYAELVKDGFCDQKDFSFFLSLLTTLFTSYCDAKGLCCGEALSAGHSANDREVSLNGEAKSVTLRGVELSGPACGGTDQEVLAQIPRHLKRLERHVRNLTTPSDFEALRPKLTTISFIFQSFTAG